MRKNGKLFHSVIAPRLYMVDSIEDIGVSVLHCWLALGLIITKWFTVQCKILDGNATEEYLTNVSREVEALEDINTTGGDNDEEDLPDVEHEDEQEEENLSPEMQARRVAMLDCEAQWTAQAQIVAQLEKDEDDLVKEVDDKSFLINRISFMKKGEERCLDAAVKKSFGVRKVFRTHFKCNPKCITSKFDHNPPIVNCSTCDHKCHVICDSFVEDETSQQTLCYNCGNFDVSVRLEEKAEEAGNQKKELLVGLRTIHVRLTKERNELSSRREQVDFFVGPMERELERILEEDLRIKRQEFASGVWVGNQVKQIIENYDKLAVLLRSKPELYSGFMDFGEVLKRLHHLTQAKRWLTEVEIQQIEADCLAIGHLYPRVFKPVSITPKLHDVIFELPRMARRFQSVGGCREDALESTHAQVGPISPDP